MELAEKTKLKADDLVTTFIARRLSPLQRRTHKICHYSGRLDPNRITTIELPKPDVRKKVKAICNTQMEDNWEWGLEPYSRANLPPAVSRLYERTCISVFHSSLVCRFLGFLLRLDISVSHLHVVSRCLIYTWYLCVSVSHLDLISRFSFDLVSWFLNFSLPLIPRCLNCT